MKTENVFLEKQMAMRMTTNMRRTTRMRSTGINMTMRMGTSMTTIMIMMMRTMTMGMTMTTMMMEIEHLKTLKAHQTIFDAQVPVLSPRVVLLDVMSMTDAIHGLNFVLHLVLKEITSEDTVHVHVVLSAAWVDV